MKTIIIVRNTIGVMLLTLLLCVAPVLPVHADSFNQDRIIDDALFENADTMGVAQIDAFLNQFPNSCISPNSGFRAINPVGYNPTNGFQYGGYTTAGQVIYSSSQAYGINPQVLLTTLQKEQSLVIGGAGFCENGSLNKYAAAVGYGCPDSGTVHSYSGVDLYQRNGVTISSVGSTCVNSAAKAGFSQQVIRGAWLLKFGEQRSKGNIGWAVIKGSWVNTDDQQSCYGGPMTQGTFQRCPSGAAAYYDGYTTIDGVAVHMNTGATASLYWYTPHFHGNQNFFSIFSGWFGSPTSSCTATGNVAGATAGNQIVSYKYTDSSPTTMAFIQQNNTNSSCAEAHIWNTGYQTWMTHIATAMRSTNPAGSMLVTSNKGKGARSELNYIAFSGGNGLAEIHKFSPDLQRFPGYYDVATNLSGVSPASGTFVAGDFLGIGTDQLAYVLYNGSTARVEIHLFDRSLTKAIGYYDVATNLSGVSPASGTFVAGDFLGRGYDQMAYVTYSGGAGRVEFHLFNKELTSAIGFQDLATNLAQYDPAL